MYINASKVIPGKKEFIVMTRDPDTVKSLYVLSEHDDEESALQAVIDYEFGGCVIVSLVDVRHLDPQELIEAARPELKSNQRELEVTYAPPGQAERTEKVIITTPKKFDEDRSVTEEQIEEFKARLKAPLEDK